MAKISLYLNSKASSAKLDWVDQFQQSFFRHELEVKTPSSREALHEEIKRDIKNKVEYIFCVGGDGTVNTILQKIVGSDIKLLIVPGGTANDMAREVGMERSIKKITQAFQRKITQHVDLIRINDQYMCTNGGIGCAADVAQKINSLRENMFGFLKVMKNLGPAVYPMIFTKELVLGKLKNYKLMLESPDLPLIDPIIEAPLVLINNQPTLGGKFHVAPKTVNNDGKFNVTIFKHQNKKDLLKCSYELLMGNYPHYDENLISFETDQLTINNLNDGPLTFFGDGEILEKSNILEIQACPEALEVCAYDDNLIFPTSHDLDQISLL